MKIAVLQFCCAHVSSFQIESNLKYIFIVDIMERPNLPVVDGGASIDAGPQCLRYNTGIFVPLS